MFTLQETPIDPIKLRNTNTSFANGAFVNFEGIVRADDIGPACRTGRSGSVNSLLYIADNPACLQEGEKILKETSLLFPITEAVCVQRIGRLNVGETAIWIGVWSPHRDEAFKACRHIIEEVKKRLRIWKKEYLTDGSSVWAYGVESPLIQ